MSSDDLCVMRRVLQPTAFIHPAVTQDPSVFTGYYCPKPLTARAFHHTASGIIAGSLQIGKGLAHNRPELSGREQMAELNLKNHTRWTA